MRFNKHAFDLHARDIFVVQGLAVSPDGLTVYVLDRPHHCIRVVKLMQAQPPLQPNTSSSCSSSMLVHSIGTIGGQSGQGLKGFQDGLGHSEALFNEPRSLAVNGGWVPTRV